MNWILTKDRLPEKPGEYLTAKKISYDVITYEVLHFNVYKVITSGRKIKQKSGFYYFDEDLNSHEETPDAWMPIEPCFL